MVTQNRIPGHPARRDTSLDGTIQQGDHRRVAGAYRRGCTVGRYIIKYPDHGEVRLSHDNLQTLRVAAQEVSGADAEAFSNHLTSIFGPREDDVAMIALRRIPPAG